MIFPTRRPALLRRRPSAPTGRRRRHRQPGIDGCRERCTHRRGRRTEPRSHSSISDSLRGKSDDVHEKTEPSFCSTRQMGAPPPSRRTQPWALSPTTRRCTSWIASSRDRGSSPSARSSPGDSINAPGSATIGLTRTGSSVSTPPPAIPTGDQAYGVEVAPSAAVTSASPDFGAAIPTHASARPGAGRRLQGGLAAHPRAEHRDGGELVATDPPRVGTEDHEVGGAAHRQHAG
jgi:hypothetical protein